MSQRDLERKDWLGVQFGAAETDEILGRITTAIRRVVEEGKRASSK